MQVAENGAHGHLADLVGVVAAQMGLQSLDALLHGLSSNQHFGDEDLAGLELLADNGHSVDHALVQDIDRSIALFQSSGDQTGDELGLTNFNSMSQFSNLRHNSILPINYKCCFVLHPLGRFPRLRGYLLFYCLTGPKMPSRYALMYSMQ